MKRFTKCLFVAACLLSGNALTPHTASAGSILTPFTAPEGALGTSYAFQPITNYDFGPVIASGFVQSNTGVVSPTELYSKRRGNDETGLGLALMHDHEINAPHSSQAILLDVGTFKGLEATLAFGSVQSGEGWRVGFSNTDTVSKEADFSHWISGGRDGNPLGDRINLGDANHAYLGDLTSKYLLIEATQGDVLLSSINVPEPASMAVLGMGLLGVGVARRKRA